MTVDNSVNTVDILNNGE